MRSRSIVGFFFLNKYSKERMVKVFLVRFGSVEYKSIVHFEILILLTIGNPVIGHGGILGNASASCFSWNGSSPSIVL